ncbi:MAG: helix-turn-helix transcriptional regulator [Actinomycetaceae bacterium]|nr:helix-turn-helix transcriptional regulator [Actinomycetaceae bacterium]
MAAHHTEAQLRVLQAINDLGPNVSIADLAEHLGGHPNASRRHLAHLESSGLITITTLKDNASGRPAKLYTVTDDGRRICASNTSEDAPITVLAHLAKHVAKEDDAEAVAYEIGKQWGESEREQVLKNPQQALTRQGFAPVPTQNEGEYDLLACPLLKVAKQTPQVICSMHRGYIDGAIPEAHTRLEPFATPRGCRVFINRTQA